MPTQHTFLAAALTVVFLLAAPASVTVAQLTCDDPPVEVHRFSSVWTLTDFCTAAPGVLAEIISGGVPRDGIPPIDDPVFDDLETARGWLADQSPVLVFELDGDARAYPLAIMTRHEIVNDVFGDRAVAVTYCPLCNSAIVFDRAVDGAVLRFGVSGMLRNSDLVMWDSLTQSWWQQFTGEGIVGAYTGTQLEMLPSQLVSFKAFAEQYPDGTVLSPQGRRYGSNPYTGYDSAPRPFLFAGTPDPRLPPTERVLAGLVGGEPVAYPFSVLADTGVVNDTVGGQDVVAFWQPGAASALDLSVIDASRDVGMAALYSRELDGQTLTFTLEADGAIRDEQTGSTWNVFGTALAGELAGSQLRQIVAGAHFWFAWAAFQPATGVYGLAAQ